ncbi:hypothetical protein TGDOM2_356640 [Toxoplasma gondii GAB2-2007-GAL-DOM2]|uniref:Uncharacterized protein n=2 Tax=Toxoplasma gondii TaxID=5811 RepID=A0A086K5C1_TOXGO|nr:hypothetical protein TGP89_356640 [Toxoplasma gondii p89]KFG39589.1 hypothetical protein TGDOM2_356640 [Toxoplasma gondii GAB2-2007-GAL-DOM2]
METRKTKCREIPEPPRRHRDDACPHELRRANRKPRVFELTSVSQAGRVSFYHFRRDALQAFIAVSTTDRVESQRWLSSRCETTDIGDASEFEKTSSVLCQCIGHLP